MAHVHGIHHVTAITSSAEKIYHFFTHILSLRLVKKTVNQDDIQTYHLFFADDEGSPGTDMTFFDFRGIQKATRGANEISRTGFRVPNNKALDYWIKRFEHYDVKHDPIQTLFDSHVLYFEDFDGQRYALFSDENNQGIASGKPWKNGPVPEDVAITGLGPIFFDVNDPDFMHTILTDILGMKEEARNDDMTLYKMGQGGNGARVIVKRSNIKTRAMQGYGAVHHVAFRIEDKAMLERWIDRLESVNARHSGFVDRFYFKSLYTRLYPGILFEFATDGPGFIDEDESYETLGETLALPPVFKQYRKEVEAAVRPFDTSKTNLPKAKETYDA